MRKAPNERQTCPNKACEHHGKASQGNIALHGYSKVKWGRRRRYRCTACEKTFEAATGTAHKRLQSPKGHFDRGRNTECCKHVQRGGSVTGASTRQV